MSILFTSMVVLEESRVLEFLRDNEPHMDHPEPKVELPYPPDIMFNGWDPDSTVYLRITFKAMECLDSGLIKKISVYDV